VTTLHTITEHIVTDFTTMAERVITDAIERIHHNDPERAEYSSGIEDIAISSWEQTWSDTSCGFGGNAVQVLTIAQTFVIRNHRTADYFVYHNGQYAYTVNRGGTPHFRGDYECQHLLGARDNWQECYQGNILHNRPPQIKGLTLVLHKLRHDT
jgi:hypothetical protein